MTKPITRPPIWLVALLVFLAFAFQGSRGIWEPDEGRYTATGLNMLETGDWLVPTVDGEHAHLTKPPITYWALAASFGMLGKNEWAARLPGALAFVGTGLLVFGLGRRLCPPRPALPALVWGLSVAPFIAANIVSTDVLLVFFETAAMLAFVETWVREDASRRRWVLAMWVGWGLAFMTKGPPALLPLLAMMVFLAAHDRTRLRGLFHPAGLVLFAIVAFTWFLLVIRQDPGRLGYFLGYEVYDRIFTDIHGRNSRWYQGFEVYVPMLLVGSLPWWPLALVAVGGPRAALDRFRARIADRDRDWLLLAYWFLLPLAIFFAAKSRLELYVLPLFVPLSIILARALARWSWLDRRRLMLLASATAITLVGLKGAMAAWPSDRDARFMAAEIGRVLDTHGLEEIAFVGMRGFYGLALYLDLDIETVRLGHPGSRTAKYVTEDDLCTELAEREKGLFALKEAKTEHFVEQVATCGAYSMQRVGGFHGDGNDIVLFVAHGPPAADGARRQRPP